MADEAVALGGTVAAQPAMHPVTRTREQIRAAIGRGGIKVLAQLRDRAERYSMSVVKVTQRGTERPERVDDPPDVV